MSTIIHYYGTLLQFGGLLALLNGFYVFIVKIFGFPLPIVTAYLVGYVGFFCLVIKQLWVYVAYMKKIKKLAKDRIIED